MSASTSVSASTSNDDQVSLPRLLGGPMLRRVEYAGGRCSVSVLVITSEEATVTLEVYPGLQPLARGRDATRSGKASTLQLAEKLHLTVVTASWTPTEQESSTLSAGGGALYSYQLFFKMGSTEYALSDDRLYTGMRFKFGYEADGTEYLPSFSFAPKLEHLHVLYGSCRKPHGKQQDLLPLVDALLQKTFQSAQNRPHHLWLLGDQIYADDVHPWLLDRLGTLRETLGFAAETLPITRAQVAAAHKETSSDQTLIQSDSSDLPSGRRGEVIRDLAGMTSTHADNHLLFAHEYLLMYLMVWSDTLWPTDSSSCPLPQELRQFREGLSCVRRALANVPVQTMFDDHDVTDDWYLDAKVTASSLKAPLGRHVLRNALVAYALFQHWGNDPAQFGPATSGATSPPGAALLSQLGPTLNDWHKEQENGHTLNCLLGLWNEKKESYKPAQNRIRWHYRLRGLEHQLLVLDSRTLRGWDDPEPTALAAGAELISETGLTRQWNELAPETTLPLTFVASATPVFGNRLVETVFQPLLIGARGIPEVIKDTAHGKNPLSTLALAHQLGREAWDDESWVASRKALQRLIGTLAPLQRVVLLSGDVHYAFSLGIDCWTRAQNQTTGTFTRFLQLCSSPQQNHSSAMSALGLLSDGHAEPQTYRVYELSCDQRKALLQKGVEASRKHNRLFSDLHELRRSPALLQVEAWQQAELDTLLKDIPYARAYTLTTALDGRPFWIREAAPGVDRTVALSGEIKQDATDFIPFLLPQLLSTGVLGANNLGQVLFAPADPSQGEQPSPFAVSSARLIHRLWYRPHFGDEKEHWANLTHALSLCIPTQIPGASGGGQS